MSKHITLLYSPVVTIFIRAVMFFPQRLHNSVKFFYYLEKKNFFNFSDLKTIIRINTFLPGFEADCLL